MTKKNKKNEIQRSRLARTTFVAPTEESPEESLSHDRSGEAEASTVLCKDCKYVSPVESFIAVDALHVQCPICLYVFFMDEAQRRAHSAQALAR
jgi:hypothetical protein